VLHVPLVATVEAQVFSHEHTPTRRGRAVPRGQIHVATNHQPRQGRGVGVFGVDAGDDPRGAHDGDAIRDGHDLAELVRDEHHGASLRRDGAQDSEQRLHLRGRQHSGRLVEKQDIDVAIEHLHDLHPLPLAQGEIGDASPWIDRELVPLAQRRHHVVQMAREERPLLGISEHDVFGHGELVDQMEMLVDHAEPVREAVTWTSQPEGARPDQRNAAAAKALSL